MPDRASRVCPVPCPVGPDEGSDGVVRDVSRPCPAHAQGVSHPCPVDSTKPNVPGRDTHPTSLDVGVPSRGATIVVRVECQCRPTLERVIPALGDARLMRQILEADCRRIRGCRCQRHALVMRPDPGR